MYCEKCGKPLQDDEQFCPNCGLAVGDAPTAGSIDFSQLKNQSVQKAVAIKEKVEKNSRKINKKHLAAIAAVAVVAVLAVVILSAVSNTVNPNQYFKSESELEIQGFDGYASVSADSFFDEDEFLTDLAGGEDGLLKIANTMLREELGGYGGSMTSWGIIEPDDVLYELQRGAFDYSVDKSENLSNGDKVTVTVTIDKDSLRKFNFKKKIKGGESFEKTYTIKGLSEVTALDPFEYISSVRYDVVDNRTEIVYNTTFNKTYGSFTATAYEDDRLQIKDGTGSVVTTIRFYADAGSYNATKKISVRIDESADAYLARGFSFPLVSKEYDPVLIDYMSSQNAFGVAEFNALKLKANEKLNEYSPVYQKAIFCTDADTRSNKLVFIYTYKNDDDETKYIYTYIEGLKIDSAGKIVTDNVELRTDGWWSMSTYDSMDALIAEFQSNWSTVKAISAN